VAFTSSGIVTKPGEALIVSSNRKALLIRAAPGTTLAAGASSPCQNFGASPPNALRLSIW
jgi:hypothetical protein